jgi:hypothetical protein
MTYRSPKASKSVVTLLVIAFVATGWSWGPATATSDALAASPPPDVTVTGDALIAVGGDIACDPSSDYFNAGLGMDDQCRHMATSDLVLAANYDAVLTLGDNQYQDGTLEAFQQSYDLTWGRFKDITLPVAGNHEYATEGASGYFDYFGAAAGTPGQGWYSFDAGQWHVVALNSNCAEVGGCSWGSPQGAWLRNDLLAHANKCTLVYWHHPRFSSGKHGSDRAVAPLFRILYRRGVDVLLAGHDHHYERFAPQTPRGELDRAAGVRQFIVGTGGKSHYQLDTALPNSMFREGAHYGILRLRLRPDAYRWRFIDINGVTRDSGTTACT